MAVQTTVEKELESLRNSVKREASIKSNIFDCEAVVTHIQCMQDDSTPLQGVVLTNLMKLGKKQWKRRKKGMNLNF